MKLIGPGTRGQKDALQVLGADSITAWVQGRVCNRNVVAFRNTNAGFLGKEEGISGLPHDRAVRLLSAASSLGVVLIAQQDSSGLVRLDLGVVSPLLPTGNADRLGGHPRQIGEQERLKDWLSGQGLLF